MGLLEIASNNSFWRGIDYFERGKILSAKRIDDFHYEGRIAGSENNIYDVAIDLEHPKKSTCNCPHAEGSRVVCKHKVALYLYFFPDEAKEAIREAEEYEEEEELRREELLEELERYVYSLSPAQLREELLFRLMEEEGLDDWY